MTMNGHTPGMNRALYRMRVACDGLRMYTHS